MPQVSVAEAAKRLGVTVPRIHQRIAEGSLRAQRIGSQWAVDELSLLRVAERRAPGRPLSERSAWALVALADGQVAELAALAPAERARARRRLEQLFALVEGRSESEERVRDTALLLRSWFRNRAERRLYRAASADLAALRLDDRLVLTGICSPESGIASGDLVEAYVESQQLDAVVRNHLLDPVVQDANVVLHSVSPRLVSALPDCELLVAADLAEHRGPREELRAAQLVGEAAERYAGSHR